MATDLVELVLPLRVAVHALLHGGHHLRVHLPRVHLLEALLQHFAILRLLQQRLDHRRVAHALRKLQAPSSLIDDTQPSRPDNNERRCS